MSIKQVIKYIELKSQLGPEELYLAESFTSMTEADKQALMDMWGVKSKPSKPVRTRVIEKCAAEGCSLTRRARVHKDTNVDGYHVFSDPHGARKSARAESLAGAIRKKTGDKEPRCVDCFEIRDHANHELSRQDGHPFEASVSARANEVLDKYNNACIAMVDDNGGEMICGLPVDDNVHHKQTDPDYHEFVGGETAVGVGG